MSDVLYVILDMVLTVSVMCVMEQQMLVKKKGKAVIGLLICACYGVIMSCEIVSESWEEIINLLISFVAALIMCEIPKKKFLLTYVLSALIASFIQSPIQLVLPDLDLFIIKIITIAVVVIIGALYVNSGKKINFSMLPKKLIVSMGIMLAALIMVTITLIVYSEVDNRLPTVLVISVIVANLAVFAIAIETITSELSKANLQKEKDILQSYNEQQKQYYELVLKSEEDTRRFRHDMVNHMLCLESYLEEGKIEDCRTYIQNITDSINHSRNKLYYTGNKISDVMLTNILGNKKEDVQVSVMGRLRDDIPIPDFDLCIVVSNVVKNAVEAVNKQNDESEKYIKINFTIGKRYLRIEEWNSIDSSQVENAEKFETSKEDKKAHGLGIKNVKMIVGKYNGSFKSEVKNNEFYVCVEMDMKSVK